MITNCFELLLSHHKLLLFLCWKFKNSDMYMYLGQLKFVKEVSPFFLGLHKHM